MTSRIYDIDNDGFVSNGELFQVGSLHGITGLILVRGLLRFFPEYNSGKIAKSLFSGSENDGWEQFERDPAAADCGQDHSSL